MQMGQRSKQIYVLHLQEKMKRKSSLIRYELAVLANDVVKGH